MNPNSFLLLGLLAVIGFVIQMVLIRWIFRIDEQVSNQKATIWLLVKMCERAGVEPSEIEQIRTAFRIK